MDPCISSPTNDGRLYQRLLHPEHLGELDDLYGDIASVAEFGGSLDFPPKVLCHQHCPPSSPTRRNAMKLSIQKHVAFLRCRSWLFRNAI
jgi:hypothetical protein